VDDAQAQGGGDGRVHAGALPGQDVEAQGRALGHVGHHRSLVKDLPTEEEEEEEERTLSSARHWVEGGC